MTVSIAPGRLARPSWLSDRLYPFASRYAEIDGSRVHYVDEGAGPPLLLLHGNPTWSFLYRDVITGLSDRFRCIAPDLPGFGLSRAPTSYRFTFAEHAAVVEHLILSLNLRGITLMVQDWGGPIGFWCATRHPERFAAFVIGNTWAWPRSDPATQLFSRLMGGPLGRALITRRNLFVEQILPRGVTRHKLSAEVMAAYRGPFPTPQSRRPLWVLPREILCSAASLATIEAQLPVLRDRPALIVWPTRDPAFGERERRRWEATFPNHQRRILTGAGHYIQEDAAREIVLAIRAWNRGDASSATGLPIMPSAELPGDQLVPAAAVIMDREAELSATPDQVWPWLIQLGQGRAGWYLPRRLERLLPPGRRALRRIEAAYQRVAVGDRVPDYGRDAWFQARVIDPSHALVWWAERGRDLQLSWALVLEPAGPQASRLRIRLRINRRLGGHARALIEPGAELLDLVTIRLMIAGLRERL